MKSCEFVAHIICFAQHFLKEEHKTTEGTPKHLIPISGKCPGCNQEILWGDLIRQRRYALEEDSCNEATGSPTEEELISMEDDEDDEFQ